MARFTVVLSVCLMLAMAARAQTLAVASGAWQRQQKSDTKPRVYVEPGPPSEIFSEAYLQSEANFFAAHFPNICPGAVITENRTRADYVIRYGFKSMGETVDDLKLERDITIFNRDREQVFADTIISALPSSDSWDPILVQGREACAVIVHHMDRDSVLLIARQVERRQPRVYVKMTGEGVSDEKGQRAFATVFGFAFSELCFCVVRTDVASEADYVLQFDMRKSKQDSSLTVLDRSEKNIFSRKYANDLLTDSLKGACQAIIRRETVEAREK